jgi:hypothetical protein
MLERTMNTKSAGHRRKLVDRYLSKSGEIVAADWMAGIKCNLCEQGALKGSCLVSENIRNKTASYQYNILEPGVPGEANTKINSWAKRF